MSALVWHAIRGRSMWPLGPPLQAGVAPVVARDLQPGEVVAFIAGHAPVLWVHRVVRVDADGLITRGDTNDMDDPRVPFSAVLGRVEAVRLGRLVLPVPRLGPLGQLHRRLGGAWAKLAPTLRRRYRQRNPDAKAA